MSRLSRAIKLGIASAHLAIARHENPSPVEGTEAAKVVPSDHDETREAKNNAVKVVTQLQRSARIGAEAFNTEDRRKAYEQIMRAGPPLPQFLQNRLTGEITTFDGKPFVQPEGPQNPSMPQQGRSKSQQRLDPEGYVRHKSQRYPKE